MNTRTLVTLLLGLIAGILLGFLDWVRLWMALVPVAVSILLFLWGLVRSRRDPFRRNAFGNEVTAAGLMMAIGIFSAVTERPSPKEFHAGDYYFEGTVEDFTATNYGDKALIRLQSLRPDNGKAIEIRNLKALVTLQDVSEIDYGCRVSGKASLKSLHLPGNYLNDDYERYLERRNIYLTGFAITNSCRVTSGSRSPGTYFRSVRDRLEIAVETTGLSPATKKFIISVLLGDKSYVNREDRLTFTDAGVAHVFAVSGFHVSMIGGFMLAFLSLILHGEARRWRYLLCIPFVWIYILIVGASPATCRAGIMLTTAFSAIFLQRKVNPLRSLAWAVILILAFDASALFDVGFQLSVVCVGALLLIAQPLNFIDHRGHPILFRIVSVVLVTITATFSAWMICAFYFHRFSLIFLPLNLVAVPLLPLFAIISILYVALSHIGLGLPLLAHLLDESYRLFHEGATLATSLSVPFDNLHPGWWSVAVWTAGLIALAYLLAKKRIKRYFWIPATLSVAAVILLIAYPEPQPSGFIIQKTGGAPSIIAYSDGRESTVTIPSGSNTALNINGSRIVALHGETPSAALIDKIREADLILLCDGCKSLPLEIKENLREGAGLVVHPSLHWRYDRRLLQEALESQIRCHSIRYHGPLHVFR